MRLIDADKLIGLLDDDIASLNKDMSREGYDVCFCTLKMAKQYIKALPTAEPKHGRWTQVWHGKLLPWDTTCCSVCGAEAFCDEVNGYYKSDYCPNCGARMDEVEE